MKPTYRLDTENLRKWKGPVGPNPNFDAVSQTSVWCTLNYLDTVHRRIEAYNQKLNIIQIRKYIHK